MHLVKSILWYEKSRFIYLSNYMFCVIYLYNYITTNPFISITFTLIQLNTNIMGKEKEGKEKSVKKAPAKNLKEKRAAKAAKRDGKGKILDA